MIPADFKGNPALEIVWAFGIIIVSIILARLLDFLAQYFTRKRSANKPRSTLSIAIAGAIKPVVYLIIIEGVILALSSITYFEGWHDELREAGIGALILVATYGLARVIGLLITWRMTSRKGRKKNQIDVGVVMFLKRIIEWAIYAVGVLILLDYLGIPISPLIAGLGIGGLAVALALQSTLANFFAGTQIISDRVVRVDDYIEIDEKVSGYVIDIGWRSTRIRTPFNNVIIIPNSKLADSLVTNYNAPNTALAVLVYCGVSYSSDLAHVEEVVLDVARGINRDLDEAVTTFEPWVGFDNFGESNIIFWVWMQAKDRLASFKVKSELVKRLHLRLQEENITINYPVRTTNVNWPDESTRTIPKR